MLAITPAESTRTRLFAAFAAIALHVAFIAAAGGLQRAQPVHTPPRITEMFEIQAPPLPPEPPELEPEPARTPAPAARARAVARRAAPAPPSSAPEPAAAAAATTRETLDFGTTFVASRGSSSSLSSSASSIATRGVGGGSSGVSARASSNGTGTSDRSRAPALSGANEWRCPFPLEADQAGVDHAVVSLRVDVASTGAVLDARAIDDPGHGFAQSARACALRNRFAPALDRAGAPTRATATVHVSFDR